MKVYAYELQPRPDPVEGLELVSQTYDFLARLLERHATGDPAEADFFFVPVNLIKWQFANQDPRDVLHELVHLGERHNHLLVALGDFSQRDERNRFDHAYCETYDWLDPFVLLALESTGDLASQDIAVAPANTLDPDPVFNENPRRYLWSFLGDSPRHSSRPTTSGVGCRGCGSSATCSSGRPCRRACGADDATFRR